jgi:hypothetical protein
MAHGKSRGRPKEQKWRLWIGEWRDNGLSVRAFYARHGLAQPSFYAWRRLIQQRDAEGGTFLPMQIVPDVEPLPTSPESVTVRENGYYRHVTPSGVALRALAVHAVSSP